MEEKQLVDPEVSPTPAEHRNRFRSKPRIIEAEQFWPDKPLPFSPLPYVCFVEGAFCVCTAHGQYVFLSPGDWVIPEPTSPARHRPFAAYPVKPDIFEATYEPVLAGVVPHAPSGKDENVKNALSRVDGECFSQRHDLPRKPPTGCL